MIHYQKVLFSMLYLLRDRKLVIFIWNVEKKEIESNLIKYVWQLYLTSTERPPVYCYLRVKTTICLLS